MIDGWLKRLEGQGAAYLWPRTPVGNLQAEAWRRVGASDWNLEHPSCRAGSILDTLHELVANDLLTKQFTVLDLCCGDGVVLLQIGRAFLGSRCYGADLLQYPTHGLAQRRAGCQFYRAPLQAIVASEPPERIDVVIMLNTFRGWDKADIPAAEASLPQQTLGWMQRHARYIFVTATLEQQKWLRRSGWFVWDVGKGEDESRMLCGFPCDNGEGRWTPGTQTL